jgi:putative membrane protein insertion efficiency factor
MSQLRRAITRPHFYLLAVVVIALLVFADSFRPPQRQLSTRAYVAAVHVYQHHGQWLGPYTPRCRFRPTCSSYSVAAVQKYGLLRGIAMSASRISRCRRSVPMGTADPLP